MGLPPGSRETRWAIEYRAEPIEPLSGAEEGVELSVLLRGDQGVRVFYLTLDQAEELAAQIFESVDELREFEEELGL